MAKTKPEIMSFLKTIDVLADGKFELAKKSYNLKFVGSSNQRIIDVPRSLEAKRVVLVSKYISDVRQETPRKPIGLYI